MGWELHTGFCVPAVFVEETAFEPVGTFAAADFDAFVEVADVLRYFEGGDALGCCQDGEEGDGGFHGGSMQ